MWDALFINEKWPQFYLCGRPPNERILFRRNITASRCVHVPGWIRYNLINSESCLYLRHCYKSTLVKSRNSCDRESRLIRRRVTIRARIYNRAKYMTKFANSNAVNTRFQLAPNLTYRLKFELSNDRCIDWRYRASTGGCMLYELDTFINIIDDSHDIIIYTDPRWTTGNNWIARGNKEIHET